MVKFTLNSALGTKFLGHIKKKAGTLAMAATVAAAAFVPSSASALDSFGDGTDNVDVQYVIKGSTTRTDLEEMSKGAFYKGGVFVINGSNDLSSTSSMGGNTAWIIANNAGFPSDGKANQGATINVSGENNLIIVTDGVIIPDTITFVLAEGAELTIAGGNIGEGATHDYAKRGVVAGTIKSSSDAFSGTLNLYDVTTTGEIGVQNALNTVNVYNDSIASDKVGAKTITIDGEKTVVNATTTAPTLTTTTAMNIKAGQIGGAQSTAAAGTLNITSGTLSITGSPKVFVESIKFGTTGATTGTINMDKNTDSVYVKTTLTLPKGATTYSSMLTVSKGTFVFGATGDNPSFGTAGNLTVSGDAIATFGALTGGYTIDTLIVTTSDTVFVGGELTTDTVVINGDDAVLVVNGAISETPGVAMNPSKLGAVIGAFKEAGESLTGAAGLKDLNYDDKEARTDSVRSMTAFAGKLSELDWEASAETKGAYKFFFKEVSEDSIIYVTYMVQDSINGKNGWRYYGTDTLMKKNGSATTVAPADTLTNGTHIIVNEKDSTVWYLDSLKLNTAYDFATAFTKSDTLYAKLAVLDSAYVYYYDDNELDSAQVEIGGSLTFTGSKTGVAYYTKRASADVYSAVGKSSDLSGKIARRYIPYTS